MSLFYALRLVGRYWTLLLVGLLLGAIAGYGFGAAQPQYAATSSILIEPKARADADQPVVQPERFVRSQIRIIESGAVLEQASEAVPGDFTLDELRAAVSVEGGSIDDVVDIRVRGNNAEQATAGVRAVTDSYVGITSADAQILEVRDGSRTSSPLRTSAVFSFVGLAIGLVCALAVGVSRRPVLGPRYLPAMDGVDVYPFTVAPPKRSPHLAQSWPLLLAWLSPDPARARGVLVTPVDAVSDAQVVADGLSAALGERSAPVEQTLLGTDATHRSQRSPMIGSKFSVPTGVSTDTSTADLVIVVATARRTREETLARSIHAAQGRTGRSIVVVVLKRGARRGTGRSRRAPRS